MIKTRTTETVETYDENGTLMERRTTRTVEIDDGTNANRAVVTSSYPYIPVSGTTYPPFSDVTYTTCVNDNRGVCE